MYAVYSIIDTVGVPPSKFSADIKQSVTDILREKYEGIIDSDIGAVVSVDNVRDIKPGIILPMDGSAYHKITFDALVYKPELKEVADAEVTELTAFGAFARLGPLDALIHVSQIMSDFISFDPKGPSFNGKESGRMLKQGDLVRARIVTASLKSTVADTKIALTMRQPFLGKNEWIESEKSGGSKKKETKEAK